MRLQLRRRVSLQEAAFFGTPHRPSVSERRRQLTSQTAAGSNFASGARSRSTFGMSDTLREGQRRFGVSVSCGVPSGAMAPALLWPRVPRESAVPGAIAHALELLVLPRDVDDIFLADERRLGHLQDVAAFGRRAFGAPPCACGRNKDLGFMELGLVIGVSRFRFDGPSESAEQKWRTTNHLLGYSFPRILYYVRGYLSRHHNVFLNTTFS
eukprot:scaffold474_cov242-Pinguiococcus_pyrenoidosus.AAC.1